MFKSTVFLVSILAACSIGLADGIDQTQNFLVGMTNGLNLLLGTQNASSSNTIGFSNDQFSVSVSQTSQGATMSFSQIDIVGSHMSWSFPATTLPMLTLPPLEAVSVNSLASQIPQIGTIHL
jgi:hypothetical protein